MRYTYLMNEGPTIFVIFGVTGDLSQRKLLPALFSLFSHNLLPKKFKIVGFSRRGWTDDDLRNFVRESLESKKVVGSPDQTESFLAHMEYANGIFDDAQAYVNLKQRLDRIDAEFGQCSNKLLYLAVAPAFYEIIFEHLKTSGLNIPCGGELGWTRVLVEKPFGNDTKTAEKLESLLTQIFQEAQIFRIDHYLAKETVQNILTFRFSNSMFEPIWNAATIEKVHIQVFEKNRVEDRGDFYDGVGALRDVGQNHLLQMLALIAMDRPKSMHGDDVRKKRAEILKKVSFSKYSKRILEQAVRAQYQGFLQEKGVAVGSQTETYFKLPAFIANKRWKNVPFVLESGKALRESKAEISVYFKRLDCAEQNVVRFRIQPNEGIEIVFWVKKPGFEKEHQQKVLAFSFDETKLEHQVPDAYERVLFDCVRGDPTLFASTDEVKYSWKFITPILEKWKGLPLTSYLPGSI
ncbi:TPA: glucose-6-phosphate dehydrogenase [Candidatus Taylorbacteria bacterium]|nr:glucose-6-phosphate dehydrogenase [Candidatus Taylorbacteria bacterium]